MLSSAVVTENTQARTTDKRDVILVAKCMMVAGKRTKKRERKSEKPLTFRKAPPFFFSANSVELLYLAVSLVVTGRPGKLPLSHRNNTSESRARVQPVSFYVPFFLLLADL